VARALVAAKVANSRALARRWARGLAAEGVGLAPTAVGDLDRFEAAALAAPDLATLRGIEGQAARLYYLALRARLRGQWDFPRRSRRPPRDPLNSLLGIVYSLLTQACVSALEVVGLDPYEGLFHADKYGRPALALDMMEPFRAYIADSLALRLVNRRMLEPTDFAQQDDGVVLRSAGWRVVLDQYAARMKEEVLVRDLGRRMMVREVVELQARRLVACLESGDAGDFRPFRVR
jgi:CRISPR-associated endonuclease Cas1